MNQAGGGRAVERTRRGRVMGVTCVTCVVWLASIAGLVGCGGGDRDGTETGQRAAPRVDEPASSEESDGADLEAAGSSPTTAAPTTSTTAAPRVVYEVIGTGTVPVNYAVANDLMQSREVTLPWSEEQAEEPSRLSMLVALTGSQGDVTCRIRRGAEVLAEETLAATAGPLLSCDYPPSGLPPVTYPGM
jgi:hypothetical protein